MQGLPFLPDKGPSLKMSHLVILYISSTLTSLYSISKMSLALFDVENILTNTLCENLAPFRLFATPKLQQQELHPFVHLLCH